MSDKNPFADKDAAERWNMLYPEWSVVPAGWLSLRRWKSAVLKAWHAFLREMLAGVPAAKVKYRLSARPGFPKLGGLRGKLVAADGMTSATEFEGEVVLGGAEAGDNEKMERLADRAVADLGDAVRLASHYPWGKLPPPPPPPPGPPLRIIRDGREIKEKRGSDA